jgi:hypothetical protein
MFCGTGSVEYLHIQFEYEEYSVKYYKSHMLWIWRMLRPRRLWEKDILVASSSLSFTLMGFSLYH